MYKVFINEKVICFTNRIENCNKFSNHLVLNFFELETIPFILELLQASNKMNVIIVVADYQRAFLGFKTYFKVITAAGGIVSNVESKKMFIYRLDKWDLPKGKIEIGEGIEEAAIREIEEECGIDSLIITKQLKDTFHVYLLKGKTILKQTHWFELTSSYKGTLVPQLEENITKVEWLTDVEIANKVLKNTYASIRELLAV